MLLSALSFLVVAQSSSEVPEGLMNNPVLRGKTCASATLLNTYHTWTVLGLNPILHSEIPAVCVEKSYG